MIYSLTETETFTSLLTRTETKTEISSKTETKVCTLKWNRNINRDYFITENISQVTNHFSTGSETETKTKMMRQKIDYNWNWIYLWKWNITVCCIWSTTRCTVRNSYWDDDVMWVWTEGGETLWASLIHSLSLINTTITALTTPLYIMSTSHVNNTKFLRQDQDHRK